jgi:hypothetical protein
VAGTDATLFVLPNGVAMCAAWAGDNTGPPPLVEVIGFYDSLRGRYPQVRAHRPTPSVISHGAEYRAEVTHAMIAACMDMKAN